MNGLQLPHRARIFGKNKIHQFGLDVKYSKGQNLETIQDTNKLNEIDNNLGIASLPKQQLDNLQAINEIEMPNGHSLKVDDNLNVLIDGKPTTISLTEADNGANFRHKNAIVNPFSKDVSIDNKVISRTIIHELTHNIKDINSLKSLVKKQLGEQGWIDEENIVKKFWNNPSQQTIDEEIVSRYFENNYGNTDFIREIAKYNNSLLNRMISSVKSMFSEDSKIKNEFLKSFNEAINDENKNIEAITTKDGKLSYNKGIEFKEYVKMIEKGQYADTNNALEVRPTSPDWMILCGYEQLPMLITINHVKSGMGIGKKGNQHNISSDILGELPNLLNDPIAAYTSHNNSIVAILRATDRDGNIIVASIMPNGSGYYNDVLIDSNFTTSMYGKERIINYYDKVLKKNKLLYPLFKTKKQIIRLFKI